MASYVVMKPPGVQDKPESIRFIRDGFSWAALVFPLPWMLIHRMWIYSLIFVLVSAVLAMVINGFGDGMAGTGALFALNLLVALESGEIRRHHLSSKGWVQDGVVVASSLDEAEEFYFSFREAPVIHKAFQGAGPMQAATMPAFGLFEQAKGR
jgi:hypothetical protein